MVVPDETENETSLIHGENDASVIQTTMDNTALKLLNRGPGYFRDRMLRRDGGRPCFYYMCEPGARQG